jgi:hypothetical protein
LLLLPIEPDADKSLGGVLLKQPSATHAKPLKISTPMSSYDLSWTAVMRKTTLFTLNPNCFHLDFGVPIPPINHENIR